MSDAAADEAGAEPLLELIVGSGSLSCAGVLNRRNRHRVLDAVSLLLHDATPQVVVDISQLRIEDVDGANALAHVQRAARVAGATLSWRGLDSNRLKGILPLQVRSRRHRPVRLPPSRNHRAMVPPSA
jgi:ABC-type transporter Mla MlaB component